MASGEHTREYLTVKTNITDIVNILVAQVDPRLFAQKLNEAHLVSSYVVQKVSVRDIPPANRVQYIIQAVLSQISLDSTKYHVFIEVLRMEQSLRTLADKLTQYYDSLTSKQLRVQIASITDDSSESDRGAVGEGEPRTQPLATIPSSEGRETGALVEDQMFDLSCDFAEMLSKLVPLLARAVTANTLKRYLRAFCHPTSKLPYIVPSLYNHCTSTEEILWILQEHCYYHPTHVRLLKRIVADLGCDNCKRVFQEYEAKIPMTAAPKRRQDFPSDADTDSSHITKKLKATVEGNPGTYSLQDVEKVTAALIGEATDVSPDVIVLGIQSEPGGSVAVTGDPTHGYLTEGDKLAISLTELMRQNRTSRYELLCASKVTSLGAEAIASALGRNTSLQTLNLSENRVLSQGAAALARALHDNRTLKVLHLAQNDIGDEGVTHLSVALQHNRSLQCLNLGHNHISSQGAAHLAVMLRTNTTLDTLLLSYNDIGDDGVKLLSEVLHFNTCLKILRLSNNHIGDSGIRHVAEALCSSTSLKTLDLFGNDTGDGAVESLCRALRINGRLQDLSISLKRATDNSANMLTAALEVNSSLKRLSIWDADAISDQGKDRVRLAARAKQIQFNFEQSATLQEIPPSGSDGSDTASAVLPSVGTTRPPRAPHHTAQSQPSLLVESSSASVAHSGAVEEITTGHTGQAEKESFLQRPALESRHTVATGGPFHGHLTGGDRLAISLAERLHKNKTWPCELSSNEPFSSSHQSQAQEQCSNTKSEPPPTADLNYTLRGLCEKHPRSLADIARVTGGTESAYFEAVKEGNTEEVNSLLKSKTFGVDDVLPGGYTALLIAAREGHGELAKSLLAHGAAIVGNVPTHTTPLLEAARHGHSEVVKVLLEDGATISDKILKEAKLHDHVEIVKMFAIGMVREAVIDASICCDVNALKELESYCDVLGESRSEFFHDKNHYTPLIHACKMIPEVEVSQEKRRQTVEYLLEKGTCALPSNESERGSGLTAFHVACETGDLQVLDMLWASVQKQENRGAVSLNITTADGWNMVHCACAGGWMEVLRWLFEKDPTLRSKEVLNAQTQDDYPENVGTHELDGFKGSKTGLHMAAFHDSSEIAKLLVDHDCLLNIKDADGNTALHVAVKRSSYEVARIVRDKSPAVAKLMNSDGKTPDQVKPDDVIPVEIVKRGKKAIDIYKEALSSGKTKIPRVTTLLLGESGAGKSSLYRLLTGQCFDSNLLSTHGIDNQVVSSVECRTVGVNQVLEEIPEDQLNCRLLANSVVKHFKTSDSEITIPKELLRKCWEVAEVVSWLQEQSNPAADLQKSHQDSKQQEVPSSGVGSMPAPDDKHAEGVDPRVPEKTAIDNESKQRSEAQAPQEAAGIVQSWNVGRPAANLINTAFKRPHEQLQHCAFFNVLDFAGQRPYIHMHHCFIVRRAIYLVVFNLQELLCFMSEGSSEDPFDKIRFWLNSIAVHSRDMEKEHTDASRIFLVGTHRQLPGGEETSKEQLRSINNRLCEEFEKKYGKDICYVDNYWLPEDDDAIFSPVENSLENWEKSGAKHLLEELKKVCYNDKHKLEFLDETYPVNWLVFEDKLLSERKTRKFVQWEEIEALAQPLGIVGDTLKTAVQFFHDTGTIVCLRGVEPQPEPGAPSPCPGASQTPAADLPSLFLTDEDMKSLENLVLLDPKWLMEVMRELMELRNINTGKIRKNLGKGYKHEDLQCLEDSGVACERLLMKRWEMYYVAEKGVTFREVCLMLQAYGLIFPKSSLLPDQNDNSPGTAPPSTCDFLVPCMLPERKEDTDSENWGNINFEFDFGDFLPKVVYHRLICLILRRSKPQKACEAELTSTYCKFSDVAGCEFSPSRWKIEIVEHKLRVIVRSVHEKPPTELVKVIHGFLRAICSKRNNLSGITYVGGPMIKKCDKCSWSGVLPYVTHPEGCEKSNSVKCRHKDCIKVYQDIDGLINPKYKQRQTADPNAEGRLLTPLRPSDLTEVCDQLDGVKVHWEIIGQHLSLPEEILEDIEDEYKNNQKRLRKMIRAWLKGRGKKPPTWQSLINALKHHAVGENATADDIRTHVLSKKA